MMPRLLLIMLLLIPGFAAAQNDADMRLSVKPVLCVTDNRTPSCDMSFLVVWLSGISGYYCLFSDFDDTPVRCWNEARAGQQNDDRTVQSNFSYWITGDDHGLRLAQVNIEVLRLDSDDRRRRRRTRHVWDIN
ncbi:MAG: DUF3019 domain-containing protein [Gammaproteobacteria bacterium]|nr:DUF3019 domain-containing protein [Gammaproteobacteria bacterium]